MPQSSKDLRKLKQKQAEERGEVHGAAAAHQKAPTQFTVCTVCKTQMRMSKRNIELVQHVEAKHSTKKFEECFPGISHE